MTTKRTGQTPAIDPLISESTKELLRSLSPKEIHDLLAPFQNGSPVIKNFYTLFFVKNPISGRNVPVTAAELIAALGAPVSFDDGSGNYYLELSYEQEEKEKEKEKEDIPLEGHPNRSSPTESDNEPPLAVAVAATMIGAALLASDTKSSSSSNHSTSQDHLPRRQQAVLPDDQDEDENQGKMVVVPVQVPLQQAVLPDRQDEEQDQAGVPQQAVLTNDQDEDKDQSGMVVVPVQVPLQHAAQPEHHGQEEETTGDTVIPIFIPQQVVDVGGEEQAGPADVEQNKLRSETTDVVTVDETLTLDEQLTTDERKSQSNVSTEEEENEVPVVPIIVPLEPWDTNKKGPDDWNRETPADSREKSSEGPAQESSVPEEPKQKSDVEAPNEEELHKLSRDQVFQVEANRGLRIQERNSRDYLFPIVLTLTTATGIALLVVYCVGIYQFAAA